MNICFFTENYRKGGVDTFLINLFNAWPDTEDKITLICNDTHAGLETILGRTVYPIKIKTYQSIFTSRIARGQISNGSNFYYFLYLIFRLTFHLLQYPILFPWYVYTLKTFFRASKFDRLMVVNGGYPASLLCRCAAIAWRLAGKKHLATFNFHSSATRSPWYFRIFEDYLDRCVVRATNEIVGVSESSLNSLLSRKYLADSKALHYIYNGIEDPLLKLRQKKFEIYKPINAKKYCLMLATYEPYKGHTFLFEAFKKVLAEFPEMKLQIFGFGTYNEKNKVIEALKKYKLGQNVVLNDFASETAPLFANASLLVVPSQAYESFGLTIIEAMAFGIPVVTTDVGGIPEVLRGSHAGYVCSKDDPAAFADAIKTILRDPFLAKELGQNGRRTFEDRFTASNMAKKYNLLLKTHI